MAQRVQVLLEDDIDGSPADRTVKFSVDGVEYEVDLSTKNLERFNKAVAPWTEKARRVGGRRSSRTASGVRSDPNRLREIREWARSNGHEVSDRGRISQEVVAAYEAAHTA